MSEKKRKPIEWTAEQRAAHRAIREAFRDWQPGPEELIASGMAAKLGLNVIYSPAKHLIRGLVAARESAGLTIAEVSARCGVDEPTLLRLESGPASSATLDLLWRYAAAIGKSLELSTTDVRSTRSLSAKNGHSTPKRTGKKKSA